jgi:hypothetical protein
MNLRAVFGNAEVMLPLAHFDRRYGVVRVEELAGTTGLEPAASAVTADVSDVTN